MNINNIDLCNLGQYITNVKGLSSNSASLSDTWLLNLKGLSADTAFVKLCLTPNSYLKLYNVHKIVLDSLKSIEYEGRIYEKTNDILNNFISPCFVRLYNKGICSFDNIVQMIDGKVEGKRGNEIIDKHIIRNIKSSLNPSEDRPSLSKEIINPISDNDIKRYKENSTFYLIVTENMAGNKKFYDCIKDNKYNDKDINCILFQVMIACYAMALRGINHNDIHSKNIFIKELTQEEDIIYIVNDNMYTIRTKYIPKIYDFDRAYSKQDGKNPLLDGSLCEKSSQCNELFDTKDFYKVFCYVWKNSMKQRKTLHTKYMNFLNKINNEKNIQRILEAYERISKCYIQNIDPETNEPISMSTKVYKESTSMEDIIHIFYEDMKLEDTINLEKFKMFICTKDTIKRNGIDVGTLMETNTILTKKISKIKQSKLKVDGKEFNKMYDVISMINNLPPELQKEIISKLGKEKYALYARKRDCSVKEVSKTLKAILRIIKKSFNDVIDYQLQEVNKEDKYLTEIEKDSKGAFNVYVGHLMYQKHLIEKPGSKVSRPIAITCKDKKCTLYGVINKGDIFEDIKDTTKKLLTSKGIKF